MVPPPIDTSHPIPDCGRLYLTVPLPQACDRLCTETQRAGLQIDKPFADVLAISVDPSKLQRLVKGWNAALTPTELERARCYLVSSTEQPTCAELMQSQTLTDLIDRVNGQWLQELIDSGRLLTHFQPVVRCANPDDVYAYECLLRGQASEGELVPPGLLYSVARKAGLLDSLDGVARLTAIESASQRQLKSSVFVNFNPRSIDDPLRSLEATIRAVLGSTISAEDYVFEVVESENVSNTEHLIEIVEHLRAAGCRVALDDVGAGYNSLNMIAKVRPDFIKLDMGLIRDVDRDQYKACITAKLLELARELGVVTVVEGVETSSEWQWARDHGADLVQGFLFARPSADPLEFANAGSRSPEFATTEKTA